MGGSAGRSLARSTPAKERMAVVEDGETLPGGGPPLLPFDGGTLELDHLAAIDAYHVVVVGVPDHVLVAHAPPLEGAFLDKLGFHHQIERPVYSDSANADTGLARESRQIVDREMTMRGEDEFPQLFPLPRPRKATLCDGRPVGSHFSLDVRH